MRCCIKLVIRTLLTFPLRLALAGCYDPKAAADLSSGLMVRPSHPIPSRLASPRNARSSLRPPPPPPAVGRWRVSAWTRALAWGAECDCRPRGVLSLALRRRSRVAGDGRALVGCRSTQDKKGSASFLSNTNRFMLRILSNPASTYSFEHEKRVRPSSCGPMDRACVLCTS